jgi:hypothetical protein
MIHPFELAMLETQLHDLQAEMSWTCMELRAAIARGPAALVVEELKQALDRLEALSMSSTPRMQPGPTPVPLRKLKLVHNSDK